MDEFNNEYTALLCFKDMSYPLQLNNFILIIRLKIKLPLNFLIVK